MEPNNLPPTQEPVVSQAEQRILPANTSKNGGVQKTFTKVMVPFLLICALVLVSGAFGADSLYVMASLGGLLFIAVCLLIGVIKLFPTRMREEDTGLVLASLAMLLIGYGTCAMSFQFGSVLRGLRFF